MNAMILAAGLGTRLRPWTLSHPKALVPVGGVPMIERVIMKLRADGFDCIVVNVHHFAGQLVEFLRGRDFGVEILISDESACLLDTGGGIVKAAAMVDFGKGPLLIHNVDILSNANLGKLMIAHEKMGADATLLVSERESQRKLLFDSGMNLRGWHNLASGEYRPATAIQNADESREFAFSGIHVMDGGAIREMAGMGLGESFPVMSYYLSERRDKGVRGLVGENLKLIDIGKPATLSQAESLFESGLM